jgi:hypothetical protein
MEARGGSHHAVAAPPLSLPRAALSSDSEDASSVGAPGFSPHAAGDGAASPDSPLGSPLVRAGAARPPGFRR